jgi:hypothetical protein
MTQVSIAQKFSISGYVKDSDSGETLIGANVYLSGTGIGTVTNPYGYYTLSLPAGTINLSASYLGYEEFTKNLLLEGNIKLDIELTESSTKLEEVVVVGEAIDRNVRDVQMSVNKLDVRTIQKLPSLLGETEILRSIQLLPGVGSVGEGAAGFNVRGGSIDQNLVLLDEAPVYNSSHLFGFFSVFNPDAVKDVQLYKGGIPARYGGRLSSILDVRMKEGNNKHFEMNGGIGTIFSRLSIEAPIIKDKASFIVAVRRSYIDVLSKPFLDESQKDFKLNFYDLTLKANYRSGENDQFFISGYFGRDNFGFGDNAGFNWGNSTATLRWNHLFSDKLFSNLTFYYSNYDYKILFGDDDIDRFDWDARIINYSVKPEITYFLSPENIVRFGGQSIFYEFQPANAIAITNGIELDISQDYQFALESSIFVENDLKFGELFEINYGLRLSHFIYLGDRNAYTFGEAEIGTSRPLDELNYFNKWDPIAKYSGLEPRLAARYQLSPTSSLKASYNRTVQYIHLLSNTTASTPLDIWTPSTNNILPQRADQVALGYFRNFANNSIEFSTEIYYKKMNHLIDYIDGADLILNDLFEGQILAGDGRAYGAEFMLKKNKGRISGWASYTLARSERLINGINNNDWYPSRFDQAHNLSLTAIYQLSKRISLSANFVYNTGTPTTFASSRFEQQGFVIPNNDEGARNNVRIPDYHRLDLSITIDPKPTRTKRWKGQWVIGVYNVYSRKNPFSIYFQQETDRMPADQNIHTEAIRLSVVGNFIPAVSYNFKF